MTDGTGRGTSLRREAYALLADGVTVLIRPARPRDLDAVRQMHEAMSQDNSYLRFFGLSRAAVAVNQPNGLKCSFISPADRGPGGPGAAGRAAARSATRTAHAQGSAS